MRIGGGKQSRKLASRRLLHDEDANGVSRNEDTKCPSVHGGNRILIAAVTTHKSDPCVFFINFPLVYGASPNEDT